MLLYNINLLSAQTTEITSTNYRVPKPDQLKWHEAELGVVYHYVFDSEIYNQTGNRINPVKDYNMFNPTELVIDQWVHAAKDAGAKFAVITATHETGFAIYQSDVDPYSLKALKWSDGSDIVGGFVNSWRKYGLMSGIYIIISCNSLYGLEQEAVEIFQVVEQWFLANGEGIYNTRITSLYHSENIKFTGKKSLYSICTISEMKNYSI